MRKPLKWLWARRWRRWMVIGGCVFLVGSVVSVEVTSKAHFCGSCHIMEPYFDSWEVSSHKDVECVKCHIEPGTQSYVAAKLNGLGQVVDDVLNRTSTKPSASVSALSCTRSGCHALETLARKEVLGDNYRFRHDKHVGTHHLGVEITCGTCHSHVKGDAHFEVNTSVCITCHLLESEPGSTLVEGNGTVIAAALTLRVRSGASSSSVSDPVVDAHGETRPPSSCTTCHDAPRDRFMYNGLEIDHQEFLTFGASCESCHLGATMAPPPIDDAACLACHTFGIERALDSREMHQVHTLGKHKIECFSCHGTVRHGPRAMSASFEAFDCSKCHANQHSIQRGAYVEAPNGVAAGHAAPADVAVNPMFLAHVDCVGCHTRPRPMDGVSERSGIVNVATPESCDGCHQDGLGARMVPLWQTATRKLYDQAMEDLERVAAGPMGVDARRLLDEARGLLELVRLDGSWGVHNPRYTQSLIEDARRRIHEAGSTSASEGGSP